MTESTVQKEDKVGQLATQFAEAFAVLQLVSVDERGRKNGIFEQRRSNVGRGHGLSGEIRTLSKEAIDALLGGDSEKVDQLLDEMYQKLQELIHLDLPEDMAWRFRAEAGQEYVEAWFTSMLYDIVVGGKEVPDKLPSPEDFDVTEPCWLAGIGDAVTEMSRIIGKVLLNSELSREERLAIRKRYISTAGEVLDALEKFETVVPYIINNNRYRGYGSTYRGLLGRVRGAIQHHADRIVEALDREAK